MNSIDVRKQEGLEFLLSLPDNSVDLILTDPPYITSRDSGMNTWVKHVASKDEEGADQTKTEEEWKNYKTLWEWFGWFHQGGVSDFKKVRRRLEKMKQEYLKYGSIYGKKYAVVTDYGSWDSEFTLETLNLFVEQFYRVLRPSGSIIIFFDIWKITNLKHMLENCISKNNKIPKSPKKNETEEDFQCRVQKAIDNPVVTTGFTQLRYIEWIKTNPQPINSSRNYLTNCREIALTAVKKGSCTFNSKYDNGIYEYPIQGGKDRFHPTQKNLKLFEELIEKHSNENDTVLDCFLGSGTTAVAALNTKRNFIGCEIDDGYYNKMVERIEDYKDEQNKKQDSIRRSSRA